MNLDDLTLRYVDDTESAAAFLRWLGERRPALAIDTETSGLDWWTPGFTRLVQFGDGQGGWAIPVEDWRGVLREALTSLRDARTPTHFWNAPFDLHALESAGLPLPFSPEVHDAAVMHRLVDPLADHRLKSVAVKRHGWKAGAGQDLLQADFAERGWTWATVPTDHPNYWAYGVLDTCLTAYESEHLRPLAPAGAYDREMAVALLLRGAERRGILVDVPYVRDLRNAWLTETEELRLILEGAGIENPNSNAQVAGVLKAAGWEPTEFTETGQDRLDKAILRDLEAVYPEVAEPLLRYKRLTKWTAAYLDRFLTARDGDDRVHPSIHTQAARTGRMSVTKPAMQTLPSGEHAIRTALRADEEHRLWAVDYDGMEYRVFAAFSGDQALIDAFLQGEDMHTTTAAQLHGCAPDEVTKPQRTAAKIRNFSRLYGAGPAKIAATDGTNEAEVRRFLDIMDRRFPVAARLPRQVEATAKERAAREGEPYIITPGGRRLPCDPAKTYVMTNYLIQGGCADLMKDALLRLEAQGLGENIVMPVHDEVLFQFPDGPEGEEQARLAHATMEYPARFTVPLTCSIEGPWEAWGDGYR